MNYISIKFCRFLQGANVEELKNDLKYVEDELARCRAEVNDILTNIFIAIEYTQYTKAVVLPRSIDPDY